VISAREQQPSLFSSPVDSPYAGGLTGGAPEWIALLVVRPGSAPADYASSQALLSGRGGGGRTDRSGARLVRPLPELVGVVGAGPFEQGGGRFAHLLSRQGCRLADELEGAWGRLRAHAQVAQQPGYDGYLGVEAAMAGDGCERKFQHALTVEVGAWREKQLDAEVLALRVHGRSGLCTTPALAHPPATLALVSPLNPWSTTNGSLLFGEAEAPLSRTRTSCFPIHIHNCPSHVLSTVSPTAPALFVVCSRESFARGRARKTVRAKVRKNVSRELGLRF
jgi:hypothetical protein